MSVVARRPQRKIPVEQLQQAHLSGPADEPLSKTEDELGEDKIVIATREPRWERVTFRNHRDPGHVLEFHYSSKECPFKQYKLQDGKQVDLPVEVIRSLESCKEAIYKHRRNSEGIPEMYVAGYKSHFMCERV